MADSAGLEGSTFTDVASVYGYPGPLVCNAADDGVFLARAWEALVDLWRQQKVVTVFTRFHPLLANHQWLSSFCPPRPPTSCENSDFPEAGLVFSGETVSIDLTLSDSENLRQYQKVLRQEIARSRRLGLVTETDDNWTSFEDFVALYQCTMSRNRAASQYFFSADYFQRLRMALGPHIRLVVTKLNDQVAAAGIFVEYRRDRTSPSRREQ